MQKLVIKTSSQIMAEIEEHDNLRITTPQALYQIKRNRHQEDQKNALHWVFLPTILQMGLFVLYFIWRKVDLIPISGQTSMSQATVILGVIGVFVLFTSSFVLGKKKQLDYVRRFPWRHYPALLLSLMIITLVSLLFFFYLFDKLFHGLRLDIYLTSVMTGIVLGVVNYAVLYFIFTMSTTSLTQLLTRMMVGGVVIAIITNSETLWWQRHLSFLGSSKALNAWQFNLTLILSGLLMIALVDSIFITLEKDLPAHQGLRILRYLLYATGFSLAMVGLFPFDGPRIQPFLHNKFAELMVVLVTTMMFCNRWLLPKNHPSFEWLSYGVAIFLAGFYVTYEFGNYITLTAFEIISFMIAFIWLTMLFSHLDHASFPETLNLELEFELEEKARETI